MSGEYMTKAECQEYLRISKSSLEKLVKQGLPRIKLERKVLFRKADVDRDEVIAALEGIIAELRQGN